MAKDQNFLFDPWRSMLQQWETDANKMLTQATTTDDSAKLLNGALRGALQMQSAFSEAMEKYLSALNLPSRGDILQLSQQIGELDRRLDELTRTVTGGTYGTGVAPADPPRPARTRKVSAD